MRFLTGVRNFKAERAWDALARMLVVERKRSE
jgi:hypothetical protein